MKFLIVSTLVFFIFSTTTQASVTDINCDIEKNFTSLDQFSEDIFDASIDELPVFYIDWIKNILDKNQDKVVEKSEYKEAACRLSKTIYEITGNLRYEYPVYMDGQVEIEEYWAYDNKISSAFEFEVAMGKEAQQWLFNYFWKNKAVPLKYRSDILELLTKGNYTVIEEDIDQQVDLAGVDTTTESIYKKALNLTYKINTLIKNNVSTDLMITYFKNASETKVFSHITSVNKKSLETVVHSFSKSKVGPREAYNFYIMQNISIKMTKDGYIWGHSKDQQRFIMKNPNFMVVRSQKFKKRIKNTLQTWTTLDEFEDLIQLYYSSPMNSENELKVWMQTMVDQLSEIFWQEPIAVEVINGHLQGRSAYLDGQKIYINGTDFLELRSYFNDDNKSEYLKHLMFVGIQEWVHYLQRLSPNIYSDNLSFYNDAVNAYRIFGNVGTFWYTEQPIEKDAQDLAKSFVLSHQQLLKK